MPWWLSIAPSSPVSQPGKKENAVGKHSMSPAKPRRAHLPSATKDSVSHLWKVAAPISLSMSRILFTNSRDQGGLSTTQRATDATRVEEYPQDKFQMLLDYRAHPTDESPENARRQRRKYLGAPMSPRQHHKTSIGQGEKVSSSCLHECALRNGFLQDCERRSAFAPNVRDLGS